MGGNVTTVAYTTCTYCESVVRRERAGVYVDSTGGDCCWHEDNENKPHTPYWYKEEME